MFSVGDLMTLIEFYDKNAIDNILSSLILQPKRVVLFGYDYDELIIFKERMLTIFKIHNIDTRVICFEIDGRTYPEIKKTLSELVEKYGDCAFDLSGGDNLIHTAMGAVSERLAVSMHTIDASKPSVNVISDVNNAYNKVHTAKLSVLDTIILNGGVTKLSGTKEFLKKPSFSNTIKSLWNICNKNCAEWNKTITNIGAVVKYYSSSPREFVYTSKLEDIYSGFKKVNKSFYLNTSIIKRLIDGGFMTIYENNKNLLQITFKNSLVKDILTKSGRLLELYTFMIGATIEYGGVSFFDDFESSVIIDWSKSTADGETSNKEIFEENVNNEIDVMFTKDVTPVFVSCKNGTVTSDELYKLSVVAHKFGGTHTKKILVATYFEPDMYFLSRAKELGISVIFNVDKMSFRKFSDMLCEAVSGRKKF